MNVSYVLLAFCALAMVSILPSSANRCVYRRELEEPTASAESFSVSDATVNEEDYEIVKLSDLARPSSGENIDERETKDAGLCWFQDFGCNLGTAGPIKPHLDFSDCASVQNTRAKRIHLCCHCSDHVKDCVALDPGQCYANPDKSFMNGCARLWCE